MDTASKLAAGAHDITLHVCSVHQAEDQSNIVFSDAPDLLPAAEAVVDTAADLAQPLLGRNTGNGNGVPADLAADAHPGLDAEQQVTLCAPLAALILYPYILKYTRIY